MIPGDTASQDYAILRRFEPVIRYTRGERFFPIGVERYIRQCSLWLQPADEQAELLVPQGELTLEKLTQPRSDGFGSVYYLKFIEPPDLIELARYSLNQAFKSLTQQKAKDVFRAGRGRLARVGYASRFVDALFSITLLLRGRVPGDTAAAAALVCQKLLADQERYCYYGRVVRENGWVVLQYWFFYPFNNWRSGFFGVNDHEGDWEMICVYCTEDQTIDPALPVECRLIPQWVAYASHDFSGDDLRRRWDDPEVEKIEDHPVIYAGAGSHASYFSPGEYLAELELPFLSPLVRFVDRVQDLWVTILRQNTAPTNKARFNVFRVPFVDYARGDGLAVGPGQDKEWDPGLLDDQTEWAVNYRGLWGLYAHDPISGENAPAGPVFNRNGTVRRSWYDPIGWAGLDKVPSPDKTLLLLDKQRSHSQDQCLVLRKLIEEKSTRLAGLGAAAAAMQGLPHLESTYQAQAKEMAALSQELGNLRKQVTVEEAKLDAFDLYEERLQQGDRGPLRAHILRAHQPSPPIDLRLGRLAEAFAAISTGGLMIAMVFLAIFARHYLLIGLAALVGLILFLEAGFRRQLAKLVTSLTVGLAIVSGLVLLFEFFWPVVVSGALAAGLFIMWENLREIRG